MFLLSECAARLQYFYLLLILICGHLYAGQNPSPGHYYWKTTPAGSSAQLVTLFCDSCADNGTAGRDIPLVSVLRDTLGDRNSENDRVTYVWLLTYSRPTWDKRLLSAVPFFYWKIGDGSAKVVSGDKKPLMNVAAPNHSVVYSTVRSVVQLAVLDPLSMPVRASTRAYRNNDVDHERLHLEEAEGYLQSAPVGSDDTGLSRKELNTVIARLDLRKTMLGDFVDFHRAAAFGEDASLLQERIRARNWELLRQCADKTGLVFEPIDLAGTKNQYAILWFPLDRPAPPQGVALNQIWKLLNLKDPYRQRSGLLEETRYTRTVNGMDVELVPLGVYSLTYPKMPLLTIDFRGGGHLRRHEMTQRAINEITSGVIGLSRFTNWYYFAGADLYNFWASRRGGATNRVERLTSYSKFRVALALDRGLDASLRTAMQSRVDSLAVNPLETSPQLEMRAALERYDLLQSAASAEDGFVARRLEKDRRRELARLESSQARGIRDNALHYASFGLYTRRADGAEFSEALIRYREVENHLDFIDRISAAGTAPEVAFESARIRQTVAQLGDLLPGIKSQETQEHAHRSLAKLEGLSADLPLKEECAAALGSIRQTAQVGGGGTGEGVLEGSIEPR